MALNIFAGARRVAVLIVGVSVAASIFALASHTPYVVAKYSIAQPGAPFIRTNEMCPDDAATHFFTSHTRSNVAVSVDLCLLAMSFGKDSTRLIPYRIDEKGMVWGAREYSSEIRTYARTVEDRFAVPVSDEAALDSAASRGYRDNWLSGVRYMSVGLVIFGGCVLAIGWIARGFLGIPRGMDRRPD